MMSRLASTIKVDFIHQIRYGFLVVALISLLIFTFMFSQLGHQGSLLFGPFFIMTNLVLGTFYFVAGMVLFEKGEGVLQGLVVTPLRVEEYLGSKVLTLTALALVENVIIVSIIFGTGYNIPLMVIGMTLNAVIYVLLGFVIVARYRSITEYLMPSAVLFMAFLLPFLDYFKIFETPLMYLHPIQGPLMVLKAAFMPVETWQLAYGIAYSLILIAVAFVLSKRAFNKHIVTKGGN